MTAAGFGRLRGIDRGAGGDTLVHIRRIAGADYRRQVIDADRDRFGHFLSERTGRLDGEVVRALGLEARYVVDSDDAEAEKYEAYFQDVSEQNGCSQIWRVLEHCSRYRRCGCLAGPYREQKLYLLRLKMDINLVRSSPSCLCLLTRYPCGKTGVAGRIKQRFNLALAQMRGNAVIGC